MINPMKEQTEIRKKLHAAALDAPKTSGVYLWKDETGQILYVGKAKSLKNRLASYFSSTRDLKTRILVSRAHSLDYITCDNEYEALLLENTLIKQHSPRYNINLKDGKTYPVIKITRETFPRIYRTRRIQEDGASYFGPFPNLNAIDTFLDFVKRHYPLRQCRVLKKRATPCLYYHIGRCSAPCAGKIDAESYQSQLEEILLLLQGDNAEAVDKVRQAMKQAASDLHFEKAARLRDGLLAIDELREQNAVVDMDGESRDYIAWAAEGIMVTFAVLKMRSGRLVARDLYRARSLKDEEEILPEFLMAYYTRAAEVPPRIFVPTENGLTLARRWFCEGLGAETELTICRSTPSQDGEEAASPSTNQGDYRLAEEKTSQEDRRHRAAMAMAQFNAQEDASRRLRERGDFPALEELKNLLKLSTLPSRIEGFDIAHIGGRLPVASLITFHDGNPYRKGYRIFRLKTTDGIIDDFASLREAVSRRYTRLLNEGEELPDLLLIDGGIGQVNAVKGILEALDLSIPVIGLAKRDEEIFLPGNSTPVTLPRRSDALRLLQRLRDETHRFATTRNQKLRTQENTRLAFEDLPGIGPKKAATLLKTWGSLEALYQGLTNSEGIHKLTQTAGISADTAEAIREALPALIQKRIDERHKRSASTSSHEIASLAQRATRAGNNEATP